MNKFTKLSKAEMKNVIGGHSHITCIARCYSNDEQLGYVSVSSCGDAVDACLSFYSSYELDVECGECAEDPA